MKELFDEYNEYCLNNFKRPDESEEIAKEYRKSLIKYIRTSTLKKCLKKANFPLNLEELMILGEFPPEGMINEYARKINEKYKAGIQLDELEIIIYRRLKNKQLIQNQKIEVVVPNNIVLKLSKCILAIENYLKKYPGQTFDNIRDFEYDNDIYYALKCIHRNCEYITNHQFKKLKELGIKLPKKIDMTIEERQNLLGKFESIAEMNKVLKITETKKICFFINDLKRRPSSAIDSEKQLAATYKKIFSGKNYAGVKKIIQALIDNEIELNLEEKMKCKFGFSKEELENIKKEIRENLYFKNKEKFDYEKIKSQIVVLYYNNTIDSKQKNIFMKTAKLIDICLNSDDKSKVKYELTKNISIIPYSILEYIEQKFNIKINMKKNDDYINIAEKIYHKEVKKFIDYFEYIKKNKKRPERNTQLAKDYINFLAGCTIVDKRHYINMLNSLRIPITNEELYITRQITNQGLMDLYKELEECKKQGKEIDYIQEGIYRNVKKKVDETIPEWFSDKVIRTVKEIQYIEREENKDIISLANEKLKNKINETLKSKIEENPNIAIDYDKILITKNDKNELETYRTILLAKQIIKKLINKMEKEQKSYYELLNNEELEKLEKYKTILKRNENILLVNKLEELNKKLSQNYNAIDKEKFIDEYLKFIKENKRAPKAENELEDELVKNYNIITKVITPEENKAFLSAIKKELSETKKSDFYERFIDFINKNERFPNKLGDSKEEIDLANDYQIKGSRLKPDQRKVIAELQKKYQKNTIEYVQRKKGK